MPFIWNNAVLHADDGLGVVPHDRKGPILSFPAPPLEPAESDSDTDVGSDSDSDADDIDGIALHPDIPPLTPTRKPAMRPRLSQANLPLPSALVQNAFRLPQPPGMAHTRMPSRSSVCRYNGTIRAQPQPQRSLVGSPFDYAQPRRGLADPRNGLQQPPAAATAAQTNTRSDDRVRAAQRLFRALGHGPNSDKEAQQKPQTQSQPQPQPRPASRISLLHGLSVRARRRHEKDAPAEKQDNGEGPVMCELSLGTITVCITPPTPPLSTSSTMEGPGMITGVRIMSHKMARNASPAPPSPTLMPPPFELAPGRALMLEERRMGRNAKVRTHTLQNKSKSELQTQLEELKMELLQLRVQKIAGGNSSKLARINTVRKNIARVLTVMNIKQRENLREFYKGKKYQPLDLREKKTRALRRALTKHERKLITERQHKKNVHFGTRRYVLKA
ncbi:60S ribosomal protein L35, L29 [Malassezia cuniculi]|uniref:60S ribosomal protein L35, L29 n=1 Tax=Malassezia cuniculi TaxID=948313 RepID=A0AAF0EWE5_9BASI|nr:60S ribosomal protein L35, L29 [Malassezia cuniculi]